MCKLKLFLMLLMLIKWPFLRKVRILVIRRVFCVSGVEFTFYVRFYKNQMVRSV